MIPGSLELRLLCPFSLSFFFFDFFFLGKPCAAELEVTTIGRFLLSSFLFFRSDSGREEEAVSTAKYSTNLGWNRGFSFDKYSLLLSHWTLFSCSALLQIKRLKKQIF